MAAAPGLLFWLLVLGPPWGVPSQPEPSPGRRFAKLKVCADHECSMLMYRAEALRDFTGPDCRFVNFKKGDAVYVYYKLIGDPPEVWAGSVGRIFGYFPKDLIKVVHSYAEAELQVPADETDFVCFDGGRDNFDSYNIEELLEFLELHDSATEETKKAAEVFELVEKPPEASTESESELEPTEAGAGEHEGAIPGSTEDFQEQFEAQKNQPPASSHTGHGADAGEPEGAIPGNTEDPQEELVAPKNQPPASSHTDRAQGEKPSFHPFRDMLHDKLKLPENENKTNSDFQVSDEQETIDAYKLLNTEMTLDLKAKFGSTADALVSDDESTKLDTSLEDDFDEDSEAEYYEVEGDKEDNTDDFDELSLLTFPDGEGKKTPEKPLQPDLKEEGGLEPPPSPGIEVSEKDVVTTWSDAFFSLISRRNSKSKMMDLERANLEEEKEEEDGGEEKPRSASESPEHGRVKNLFAEDYETDGKKDPAIDPELLTKGKDKAPQEPKADLVQEGSKSKDIKQKKEKSEHAYSSQHRKTDSLPATGQKEFSLKSVYKKTGHSGKEPVVHISKETLYEENTGEVWKDNSESKSTHTAGGRPAVEENIEQESLDVVLDWGDNQPDGSKDSTEEADFPAGGPETHPHSAAHQWKPQEDLGLQTQNQSRFSAPEEMRLSGDSEGKAQEEDATSSVSRPTEKAGLSDKGRKDLANAEPADSNTVQQPVQETGNLEVPGIHLGEPEMEQEEEEEEEEEEDEEEEKKEEKEKNKEEEKKEEKEEEEKKKEEEKKEEEEKNKKEEDEKEKEEKQEEEEKKKKEEKEVEKKKEEEKEEEEKEEEEEEEKEKEEEEEEDDQDQEDFSKLLDDENAISAQWSRESPPGVQDRKSGVTLQVPEVPLGTLRPDTEGSKQEQQMILEPGEKSVAGETDGVHEEPDVMMVVLDEESSGPSERAQRPPKASDSPELGEVLQSQHPEHPKKDSPKEQVNTPETAGEPGEEEEEDAEVWRPESQRPISDDPEDHLPPSDPPTIPGFVLESLREDLPIISSFSMDERLLYRFLKYLNVHKLEGMLQEMSLRLKSAQRDSLPYNVDKVLEKVFRASESRILAMAEAMLDAQVSKNRELGVKERSVLEEAAVLDDIQDLLYFVRYQHSGVETTPLLTPPPLQEERAGMTEEGWPPQEDGSPRESRGDASTQPPDEPGVSDQPVTDVPPPEESRPLDQASAGDVAAPEVSPKPDTEDDADPGLLVNEETLGAGDAQQSLETSTPEAASPSLWQRAVGLLCLSIHYLYKMLVATLPEEFQPGSHFYGLPWKPVAITAFLGIVSLFIFFRNVFVVNRLYQVTERQIYEKLENIKKENAQLMQTLSSYEQKMLESKKYIQETKEENMILSNETIKCKDKIKTLEENNEVLIDKAKSLRLLLESEREQSMKKEDLILENKKSIDKLNDVISVTTSELSEFQIALNEIKLREETLKSECHRVQEENASLKKKKEELQQQIEDWSKSHAALSEQMKILEKSQKDLELAAIHKDDSINALTYCITQLNHLEHELNLENETGGNKSDELANGEVGGDQNEKIKNQIKLMMDGCRAQTAISVAEEDLKLLQLKLRATMSSKCKLEDQIKKLEDDYDSLQTAKSGLEDECQILKQKLEILNELYQQKEMTLHKKLSREEYDRQNREQQLSTLDEKVIQYADEAKMYKQRAEEMKEELQKTERSFKDQIAAHEKKAHENWLKARAAERAIAEEKREAANLRHKLLELTQKMTMRQDEPMIVKPMPGRPTPQNPPRRGPLSQNGSFGPSPVSGGECSPPLSAELPGRPLSAPRSRRDMPRSEFDPGPVPTMSSSSRGASPVKVPDEGKPEGPSVPNIAPLDEYPVTINIAAKGPPPFPGVPLMGPPLGGPVPPPIRYGPPPQFVGPFGPRPLAPPFVPGVRPPIVREYAPGVLPVNPREFLPGHVPFRPPGPLGPREYFFPGPGLPPPAHGPQHYPPPRAARDPPTSGPREEPPPASQNSDWDQSQA